MIKNNVCLVVDYRGAADVYRCPVTRRRPPSGFDKATIAQARSGAVQLGGGVRRRLRAKRLADDQAQLYLPR